MSADDIIAQREKTHGSINNVAAAAQEFRREYRNYTNWRGRLSAVQCEALDNIAGKIARILAGDPDCLEHWRDIQGYARLAERDAHSRGAS